MRDFEAGRRRLTAARRTLDGIGGLGWSVIGFLLGAVFWHFVGFWSFVSEVVLAGHSAEQPRPAASQFVTTSETSAGSHDVPLAVACTALVLDRRTGATSAGGCARDFAPAAGYAAKQREDRASVAEGNGAWAAPGTPARAVGSRRP